MIGTENMVKHKELLIIGAGGHGKVAADIARKMRRWQRIKFLDDNENIKSAMGIDVIDITDSAANYIRQYDIFIAIGCSKTREKIQEQLLKSGANIPRLIHPCSIIGDNVEIGIGTVIMAGAVINCCSKIGRGCIINTGSTIGHDNTIEDYVHISSGVHTAGTVKVGKNTWIGIGSVISNNINVTGGCVVGAGTVIVKDIIEAGIYVGVPARKIAK